MKEVDIADRANNVMKELFKVDGTGKSDARNVVTTSQIRKFLTAIGTITEKVNVYRIQNPDSSEKLPEELQAEIKFLKVKLAYQIGRTSERKWDRFSKQYVDIKPVEDFEKAADLIKEIDAIKDSTKAWQVFANYMEALVAFHKYYGGRDK